MKTINVILILSLGLIAVVCQSTDNNLTVLDIDKALSNESAAKLSDFASSLSYVVLETPEDGLIDESSLVFVGRLGEDLLLADSRSCFLFDGQGGFIRKIGRQGNGPGEYTSIRRVVTDGETRHVYISQNGPGILEYNIDGEYLQTLLPDNHMGAWTFMGDDIISDLPNFRGDNPYMLAALNRQGDTLSLAQNHDIFRLTGAPLMFTNDPFSRYDTEINYFRLFNDTIYNIARDTRRLSPKFVFRSATHSVPLDLRQDGNAFVSSDFDYIIPWSTIETKSHLFISALRNGNGLINFIYDKQQATFSLLDNGSESDSVRGIENDIDGGLPIFPTYKLDEGVLCSVTPAYLIVEYMEDNPEFSPEIFSGLTDASNPVLTLLHI
jgi:hypothetical protein